LRCTRKIKTTLREPPFDYDLFFLLSLTNLIISTAEEAPLGRYLASEDSAYGPPTDVFVVTNFPRHLRSFSIHPSAQNDSESFDIILRGQEIIIGCRLLNHYKDLRKAMTTRKYPIDPDCDGWRPYVQSHEIGMPPWGGFGCKLPSLGSETGAYTNCE
jgi:aspartyl/asparaginyl-tRNA synthetase